MTTANQIEQLIDSYKPKVDLSDKKQFLVKWGQALESYGTPVEFVMSTRFEEGKFDLSGKTYGLRRIISENNAMRQELMSKQKKYENKSEKYDLNLSLDNCFLCQNIAQAEDSKANSDVASNIVEELQDYYVLPNRYPANWGHSLWIPKNIDDMTFRVAPTGEKKDIYIPEEGKTRGKVLKENELKQLFELCDNLGYVAQRNHVLDAMSIPGHDHFHLQFDKYPNYGTVDMLALPLAANKITKGIYRANATPFDTLVITPALSNLPEAAAYILENMEKDNQVFTLAYHKGNLLVSPRKNNEDNKRLAVGAGVHLHSFDKDPTVDIANNVLKHVPLKGEFNWKKYL
ncbi:MAG TPA: hypothetical protein VEC16_03650 [Alphaproteobacteria bacterium]|nr:hypothetical protein [Alphaproteobacteria bacterium]